MCVGSNEEALHREVSVAAISYRLLRLFVIYFGSPPSVAAFDSEDLGVSSQNDPPLNSSSELLATSKENSRVHWILVLSYRHAERSVQHNFISEKPILSTPVENFRITKLTMIKSESYDGNPKPSRSARSSLLEKPIGIYADLVMVETNILKWITHNPLRVKEHKI